MKTILNNVFTGWKNNNALFDKTALKSLSFVGDNDARLNRLYFGSHSGCKLISPYLSKLLDNNILTDETLAIIADDLAFKFGFQWSKAYTAISMEYNVIDNYTMTETGNRDKSKSETEAESQSMSNQENVSSVSGGNDTTSSTLSQTGENKLYGFNSQSPVPSDENTDSRTGTSTVNYGGTNTETVNRTSSNTNNISNNGTEEESFSSTKHGNVGAKPQDMILAELEVRKYNFYNMIFRDIDSVIALSVYDACKLY